MPNPKWTDDEIIHLLKKEKLPEPRPELWQRIEASLAQIEAEKKAARRVPSFEDRWNQMLGALRDSLWPMPTAWAVLLTLWLGTTAMFYLKSDVQPADRVALVPVTPQPTFAGGTVRDAYKEP
jgi:hypothetical protein